MLRGDKTVNCFKRTQFPLRIKKRNKMKKLIIVLMFAFLGLATYAQERTVYLNGGKVLDLTQSNKIAYNGNVSDRLLPTTRDTIDYIVIINSPVGPIRPYVNVTMSPILGADTTVAVTVDIKKFGSETWSNLISTSNTTAIVSANIQTAKTSLGVTTEQTSAVYNTLLFFNYIRVRLILKGDDHVGTGIQVNRVEFNFWM
jgi:hypothetical protein